MTKVARSRTVRSVRSEAVSTRELEEQLWMALGRKHNYLTRVVPSLVQAVGNYRETERATDSERAKLHDQLRRQVDAAGEIGRKARELLIVIRKRRESIRAAVASGNLPKHFAHLADAPLTLADLARGIWVHADPTVDVVAGLAGDAKDWERTVRMKACRRPGRETSIRRYLVSWVGLKLARERIILTTTKSGCWARVLTVMNEAVGLDVNPYQCRDLQAVLKQLRHDHPDLVGSPRQQNPRPE